MYMYDCVSVQALSHVLDARCTVTDLRMCFQLLLAFNAKEALEILQYVVRQHEVNWGHLLSFTATVLVLYEDAADALAGICKHHTNLLYSTLLNVV